MRTREQKPDAALAAEIHELPGLVAVREQRILSGHHEAVEVARLDEAAAPAGVVDAGADGFQVARAAQLVEGLVGAVHRGLEVGLGSGVRAMREGVDIVDEGDVDA